MCQSSRAKKGTEATNERVVNVTDNRNESSCDIEHGVEPTRKRRQVDETIVTPNGKRNTEHGDSDGNESNSDESSSDLDEDGSDGEKSSAGSKFGFDINQSHAMTQGASVGMCAKTTRRDVQVKHMDTSVVKICW